MPILDFGINVEEVKKRQNGKEICDYTDDGNLLLKYSYYTNEISYCTYAFDENDKLEATMLVFKSLSYQQKVKSYLEEHFNFVGRRQGRLLFVNADPEDIRAKKKGIILAIVGVEYLRKESDLKLYVFFNLWK